MRIEDITKQGLIDATDLDLKKLLYKFSQFWERHFQNNSRETVGCFKRNDFIRKYRMLLREMDSDQRSLQHSTCDLDRQAFKQKMRVRKDGIDLSPFEEIVTEANCVLLDENFDENDKIDVIVQAEQSFSEEFETEITEIIKEQFNKECKFTYDPEYDGTAIPLFHQVLRPVEKIKKVEIKKDKGNQVEKSIEFVGLEKADQQIVYGIVYEPDTEDAQGDKATSEEIQKAAYNFMENAQAFKVMHKGKKVNVKILENYLAPCDFEINKRQVKKGTWILATRILDKALWKKIKAGDFTGYSMAGYAKVE
jgi:hypothetical protein